MYFDPEIARSFAEREQNEKNFRVSEIVDMVIMNETRELANPLHIAELGGGAHPDRYHVLFRRLVETGGRIDWVDISPQMLELAREYMDQPRYRSRESVIQYINAEMIDYLGNTADDSLDIASMKYTIDHIKDLDSLLEKLSKKLKSGGRVVATIGMISPELKSVSTNARFLHNGEEFPENETRTLQDGDSFTVRFFKESGNPQAGYLEGAETIKYYHSPKKLRDLALRYGFKIFIGDWKDAVPECEQTGETMDQDILVLAKA